jgi:RND superfamily putative drug exporter
MARILARIGGFSARHRWSVLIGWVILLLLAVGGSVALSKATTDDFNISGLPSLSTLHTVDRTFHTGGNGTGGSGTVVFAAPRGKTLTATDVRTVAALAAHLRRVPGVAAAVDPFTSSRTALSPDRRIGYVAVSLRTAHANASTQAGIAHAVDNARSGRLQVEASDGLTAEPAASSSQLPGIVLALIILFVTFGSLIAAGLPLVTALLGLGVSVTGIYSASVFGALNSVTPVFAILLALAVGIDYSLFIVNRHRRQLTEGMEVRASIRLAAGTAGTAVFFAAATVIVALAGLAIVRVDFLTQMGLAAAFAVFVAMLIALTLTPALLSLTGVHVLTRRARRRMAAGVVKPSRHPARRWAGLVGRHPVVAVIAGLLVLGTLAVPVLSLRLGLPNPGTQPSTTTERRAYDLMADGFGAGVNGPMEVLARYRSEPSAAAVVALAQRIAGLHDVAHAVPSGRSGRSVLLTVIPSSGPSDAATETLVARLRAPDAVDGLAVRPTLRVTGQTAVAIDISQRLLDALPLYLGVVAGFAFLLLLVVFRSVLIPLKTTLSFLLSLGASLGATVAVFQFGWLGNVFGVDPAAPLLSFLPVLVIGVLFGLSMDYEMFLVSGMREQHVHGVEAREAVTGGFGEAARVVAAAALIMIGVFGNGVLTGSATIRPIAFALAAGVLIDAFVVRMTLVPAVMTLFGRAAWWLPRWLGRIVPQVDIEGASLHREEVPVAREAMPVER